MKRIARIHKNSAFIAGLLLAFATGSMATGAAVPGYFVRRGGVICENKADMTKVARSFNSMHHFGQIRYLKAAGLCQTYPVRTPILEPLPSSGHSSLKAVQVRTVDKPNSPRWVLGKDIGERKE
jgi:hypothetical protein